MRLIEYLNRKENSRGRSAKSKEEIELLKEYRIVIIANAVAGKSTCTELLVSLQVDCQRDGSKMIY